MPINLELVIINPVLILNLSVLKNIYIFIWILNKIINNFIYGKSFIRDYFIL